MPYKYRFYIYIILLIILFLLAWVLTYIVFDPKTPVMPDFKGETLYYIGGNTLVAVSSPATPQFVVYGIIIDECFYHILKAESGFNPKVCNLEYGCGSGIGLGQLTKLAIKECEMEFGRSIDPFDPYDNIECSLWLYGKYGTSPWGTDKTWWGSWEVWNKYCY